MTKNIIDSENMSDHLHLGRQTDSGSWASNGASMQNCATVILVSPDVDRRRNLARSIVAQQGKILTEFNLYPGYANLTPLFEVECDAFVVEIDSDVDLALELVEAICGRKPSATVMVYSETQDPQRVMAAMRAGAREYLVAGQEQTTMRDALVRAAVRRTEQESKKTLGNIMAFWGAKGGSGVTTLAANFAIALRNETGADVVLVDLNPTLGDAALLLGIEPRFTIGEAFSNPKRIDREFVTSLVVKHESGLAVIAAPDTYRPADGADGRAVGRLLETLRSSYAYIVIDAGPGLGPSADSLFQMADTVYLVTQLDIVSLRNAQRVLAHIHSLNEPKVQLVVNRYEPKRMEFEDDRVTKALGKEVSWKVPNDYLSVHRSSNTGSPLMSKKSGVTNVLRMMARAACGKPMETAKKKGWLFG